MRQVTVVIPIYAINIPDTDRRSVERCFELFAGKYPITFVKPDSLDISPFVQALGLDADQFTVENFEDHYFRSIASYNALMMSERFYQRFIHSEYILIYQTDCYVFRDELSDWCSRGYDYVGAPWIGKPKYDNLLYRAYIGVYQAVAHLFGRQTTYDLVGEVGNGGFSLRRTSLFARICSECRPVIDSYLKNPKKSLSNEDVFFSITAAKEGFTVRKPDMQEALKFAYDKNPQQAHKLNNYQLPMGCHGWNKRWGLRFWTDKM